MLLSRDPKKISAFIFLKKELIKIKVFGDKSEFFKKTNEILSSWDWRHDNLHRYSNYFLKHKGLFKSFSDESYTEFQEIETEFILKWCDFKSAEQLLIMRASGYDKTFFFKKKITDPNNAWGYSSKRVKFDHVDLQKDIENIVLWCDCKRAELYSTLSVDFLRIGSEDKAVINSSDGQVMAIKELRDISK